MLYINSIMIYNIYMRIIKLIILIHDYLIIYYICITCITKHCRSLLHDVARTPLAPPLTPLCPPHLNPRADKDQRSPVDSERMRRQDAGELRGDESPTRLRSQWQRYLRHGQQTHRCVSH